MSKKNPYKNVSEEYSDLYIRKGYNTLKGSEIDALIKQTINKGAPLTEEEIINYTGKGSGRGALIGTLVGGPLGLAIGSSTGSKKIKENHLKFYKNLLNDNADYFGFDSSGESVVSDTDKQPLTTSASGFDSGLDPYVQLVRESLMTDPTSSKAQEYRDAMFASINQYEQSSQAALAGSEMEAYRALGQQQLQLENQIAEQRMHAIKSGVTSAQLASQELANIFAAQAGASQIAAQVMQNRVSAADTFAKQRAAVEPDLYGMINTNQQTAANAYTQLGAAQASYNSYAQQPYNQYMAALQAYEQNPSKYSKLLGIKE